MLPHGRKQLTVRQALKLCEELGVQVKETKSHYQLLRVGKVPVTLKKSDATRPVSPKIRSLIRQLQDKRLAKV